MSSFIPLNIKAQEDKFWCSHPQFTTKMTVPSITAEGSIWVMTRENQTLRNGAATGWKPHLCTSRSYVQSLITHLSFSCSISLSTCFMRMCAFVYACGPRCVSRLCVTSEKDKTWLSSCLGDRLLSKEKGAEAILIKTTINTVASIKCLPRPHLYLAPWDTHTEHRKLQRFYYCKFNKSTKALFSTRWGLCSNGTQAAHYFFSFCENIYHSIHHLPGWEEWMAGSLGSRVFPNWYWVRGGLHREGAIS